jgi:hypothetical protein
MDPALLWAVIVAVVLVLIIASMVNSKLRQRKTQRLRREAMPVVPQSVQAGVSYKVFLNNGSIFEDVKVVGLTDQPAWQFVDFPLESWLVLERMDGKRIFVKPASVRYFEEL